MQAEQKNCFTDSETWKETGEPIEFPFVGYQPHIWKVQKDDVYFSIECIERALDYAHMCLRQAEKERDTHSATYQNKVWQKTIEHDINFMTKTLASLRGYDGKDEYYPPTKETK
jgi:hypothetical protein